MWIYVTGYVNDSIYLLLTVCDYPEPAEYAAW